MIAIRCRTRTGTSGKKASPREEHVEVFVGHLLTPARAREGRPYAFQDDEIGDTDNQQEQRGYGRADGAADRVKCLQPLPHGHRRRGNDNRSQHDDGGMPERKGESRGERRLAFLHQLADDVIDRRNMIGIESMAKTEHVGQHRRAEQSRFFLEGSQRPDPGRDIRRHKQGVDEHNLGS